MEQIRSWEANRSSAGQEIPHISWNPNVHYGIHNSPPPAAMLSQINPLHAPHHTLWRSSSILSSHLHLGLPSGLFSSGFPTKNLYTPLPSLLPATCSAHLILLYLITQTIFGEQYRSLSTSLCSFLHTLTHINFRPQCDDTLPVCDGLCFWHRCIQIKKIIHSFPTARWQAQHVFTLVWHNSRVFKTWTRRTHDQYWRCPSFR